MYACIVFHLLVVKDYLVLQLSRRSPHALGNRCTQMCDIHTSERRVRWRVVARHEWQQMIYDFLQDVSGNSRGHLQRFQLVCGNRI